MKFYCFSLVLLICIVFQSITVVSLQIENADHVRTYVTVEYELGTYKHIYAKQVEENKVLRNQLRAANEKRETTIVEKDIKIEKLAEAVVRLYRIIEHAAKNQDRET